MANVRADRDGLYWVGAEKAQDFAVRGALLLQAMHRDRPAHARGVDVALEVVQADEFEAHTSFANGRSTIRFSEGWLIRMYEAFVGASMMGEWPLLLLTKDAGNANAGEPGLTQLMSSMRLASIALRFVYLHEFSHAALGHCRFIVEQISAVDTSGSSRTVAADDVEQLRATRAAFELEADCFALKSLFLELYDGAFDSLFACRGAGVVGIGFAIELLYTLHVEMSGTEHHFLDAHRFEDPGIYCHPVKRKFYLLTELVGACESPELGRALEHAYEYGASAARSMYARVQPPSASIAGAASRQEASVDSDKQGERDLVDFTNLLRSGHAMHDPADWVMHQNTILQRVRPSLHRTTLFDRYRFTLSDGEI